MVGTDIDSVMGRLQTMYKVSDVERQTKTAKQRNNGRKRTKTSYKQEFKIYMPLMRKAVFQIRIWEEERIFRKGAARFMRVGVHMEAKITSQGD